MLSVALLAKSHLSSPLQLSMFFADASGLWVAAHTVLSTTLLGRFIFVFSVLPLLRNFSQLIKRDP